MLKVSDRLIQNLHVRTGASKAECAVFMEDFNKYTLYLSSRYGLKQKDVAVKVFEQVRRAELADELAEGEALPLEEPPTIKDNEVINEGFLADIFGN